MTHFRLNEILKEKKILKVKMIQQLKKLKGFQVNYNTRPDQLFRKVTK
jgi:hypothetical protein